MHGNTKIKLINPQLTKSFFNESLWEKFFFFCENAIVPQGVFVTKMSGKAEISF